MALRIKMKQKDLETRIDHAPACVLLHKRNSAVTACTFPSRIMIPTHYKALTLHSKQLFLRRDRSRSHKSAV